jgi:hypothetical protein
MSLPTTLEDLTRAYWYAATLVRTAPDRDRFAAKRTLYHVAAHAPAGGRLQDRSILVIGIIEGVVDHEHIAGEI